MKNSLHYLYWLIIIVVISICGLSIFHSGYLNFQAYCSATGKRLTDQEKIELAIISLLKYYPKTQHQLARYYDAETRPTKEQMNEKSMPLLYRNVSDFKRLNPSCCQVTQQPDGFEFPRATILDRASGSKSSFVSIKFLLRFKGEDGHLISRQLRFTVAIKNCGLVWNGI